MNSLYILLNTTGRTTALSELYKQLPTRHENGYSFFELKEASGQLGLELWAGYLTQANLPLKSPVIAYFEGQQPDLGHYVVLKPVGTTGTMVEIIDPPYHPRIVDYSEILPENSSIRILHPTQPWPRAVAFLPLAAIPMFTFYCLRRTRRGTRQAVLASPEK